MVDSPLRLIWFAGSGAVGAQQHLTDGFPGLGKSLLDSSLSHNQYLQNLAAQYARCVIYLYDSWSALGLAAFYCERIMRGRL